MAGVYISIPCNIHQLCYAEKKEEKTFPLTHARPAAAVP